MRISKFHHAVTNRHELLRNIFSTAEAQSAQSKCSRIFTLRKLCVLSAFAVDPSREATTKHMTENEISAIILDKSIKVHKALGPGLYESVYEECLVYELNQQGISFVRQKEIPVIYEGVRMDIAFKCDLMIEQKVIVELKSISSFDDLHVAQVLTYLKLSDCKLGLLINFNVELLKNGFRRIALYL